MEYAETFAAELKAAEAALKAEQAEVAREQKALDAERARPSSGAGARSTTARARERRGEAVARGAVAVRAGRARPQGHRRGRSPRRPLHRSATSACGRRCSTRSAATTACTSATAARGSSYYVPPAQRAARPSPPDRPMIVAYIDGGARGNPGPAGYGVRIESSATAPSWTNSTAGLASRPTTSPNTTGCWRPSVGARSSRDQSAHSCRLRTAREADARRRYKVKNAGAASRSYVKRPPARRPARPASQFERRAPRAQQWNAEPTNPGTSRQPGQPRNPAL